jgi:MFS family permease
MSNSSPSAVSPAAAPFTRVQWLIIIIASIGFLFDTYELLMTPLVGVPAIAELLRVPPSHPLVAEWMGNLLWMTALCGGVFGLLGGRLIDQFGRKRIMALSIFVYSFSPFAAAYSTSLGWFIFFRCATFIGVCVEFVAAITWLSEVFEDKKQRGRWLGITQAFASLGGVLVTAVAIWIGTHMQDLPHWGLPTALGGTGPDKWRYLLMTGILPAIPIALLLPFVPESPVWKARKDAGTLQRPSFSALFAPELRRTTLVTAALSACAYGIAFGALQLTPKVIAPGLPELSEQAKSLAPLRAESKALMVEFDRVKGTPEQKAVVDKIKANKLAQDPFLKPVESKGEEVQMYQEMGGLAGRILLAILVILGMRQLGLLRLFQIPSLIILPLTYLYLFNTGGFSFMWAYALCGLLTVAQFSYMGEYLPKVFPLHLRGTGGSFATNVGGRMIGTSMALVTSKFVAPMIAGGAALTRPIHFAQAAGYVACTMAVISFMVSFFLPKAQVEETPKYEVK